MPGFAGGNPILWEGLNRAMKHLYEIAVIPGDGTGPEVVAEALKVLSAVEKVSDFTLKFHPFDLGGERYLRNGELLSQQALLELREFDSILLGAIGHPAVEPGILEKEILLKMRFELDLYVNLRPVKLLSGVDTPLKHKGPEHIDFVVVRENSEGLYTGGGGFLRKGTADEVAVQESINTRKGVDRCLRYAFEFCRKRRERKKLTLCGKTNVLTYAFDLWKRAFTEMSGLYPDVATDYAHVDAICMWMVKNPEWFDVIVTDNMFGDIITDLGAIIQGGLGLAAGGNINPEGVSMFEPIGGSAPKYAGKNVINPLAAICAAQMMLEHLSLDEAGRRVHDAVGKVVKEDLKSMDAGAMGMGTREVGDRVAEYVLRGSKLV